MFQKGSGIETVPISGGGPVWVPWGRPAAGTFERRLAAEERERMTGGRTILVAA